MGEDPNTTPVKNYRIAALSLCLWHGLARFEEMAGVKLEHVRRLPGGSLELFITEAKNNSMGNRRDSSHRQGGLSCGLPNAIRGTYDASLPRRSSEVLISLSVSRWRSRSQPPTGEAGLL